MLGFIVRRLLTVIPTFLGLSALTFALEYYTYGNPLPDNISTQIRGLPVDQALALIQHYRFGSPWYQGYSQYLLALLHGSLGLDPRTYQPISTILVEKVPFTIELAVAGLLISIAIGVPIGVVSAMKRGSLTDHILRLVTVSVGSFPNYWWGIMLMIFFAVDLRVLPISGATEPTSIILPALTLGTIQSGLLARLVRNSMLEAGRQDYIRTALAKGLSDNQVAFRHTLRNAFLPILTILGIQFGFLLAGVYFVEMVFAWPGIGQAALNAAISRDFPLVQGAILVTALSFIVVNLCVDILYAYLDPRTRFEETRAASG